MTQACHYSMQIIAICLFYVTLYILLQMQSQDECSTIEIVDTHVFQAILEPGASKRYKLALAPTEDSDQIAHARNLIRVLDGRFMGCQGTNVSSSGKLRL